MIKNEKKGTMKTLNLDCPLLIHHIIIIYFILCIKWTGNQNIRIYLFSIGSMSFSFLYMLTHNNICVVYYSATVPHYTQSHIYNNVMCEEEGCYVMLCCYNMKLRKGYVEKRLFVKYQKQFLLSYKWQSNRVILTTVWTDYGSHLHACIFVTYGMTSNLEVAKYKQNY